MIPNNLNFKYDPRGSVLVTWDNMTDQEIRAVRIGLNCAGEFSAADGRSMQWEDGVFIPHLHPDQEIYVKFTEAVIFGILGALRIGMR